MKAKEFVDVFVKTLLIFVTTCGFIKNSFGYTPTLADLPSENNQCTVSGGYVYALPKNDTCSKINNLHSVKNCAARLDSKNEPNCNKQEIFQNIYMWLSKKYNVSSGSVEVATFCYSYDQYNIQNNFQKDCKYATWLYANMLYNQKHYSSARTWYLRYDPKSDDTGYIQFQLASIYELSDNADDLNYSLYWYNQALEASPDSKSEIYNNMGVLYQNKLGDYTNAFKYYKL